MCGYHSAGPAGAADWSLTVITRQSKTPGALSLSLCHSVQLKMDSDSTNFMPFFPKHVMYFAFVGPLIMAACSDSLGFASFSPFSNYLHFKHVVSISKTATVHH